MVLLWRPQKIENLILKLNSARGVVAVRVSVRFVKRGRNSWLKGSKGELLKPIVVCLSGTMKRVRRLKYADSRKHITEYSMKIGPIKEAERGTTRLTTKAQKPGWRFQGINKMIKPIIAGRELDPGGGNIPESIGKVVRIQTTLHHFVLQTQDIQTAVIKKDMLKNHPKNIVTLT